MTNPKSHRGTRKSLPLLFILLALAVATGDLARQPADVNAAMAQTGTDPISQDPPSAAGTAPVSVPEKQWLVLPLPPEGAGISRMDKHVTLAFSPLTNRVYFTGGDYLGTSYRQETWSLDIAERLRHPDNPSAGWRLEYPYCGPVGAPQPKGPDFVGWTWDPKRNVFWMVPGEMQPHGPYSPRCPGERPDYSGDEDGTQGPKLLFRHIMTFDPVSRRWADYDTLRPTDGQGSDTWSSAYDPMTDTLVRASPSHMMGIYNISRKKWTHYPLGRGVEIQRVHWATDYDARRIFMIDPVNGRLHRWNMDARTLSDLGRIPGGPISGSFVIADKGYCVWDSSARVLIHYRPYRQGVFVYHPDEKPPRWEATDFPLAQGTPAGLKVHWNGAAFDPVNNLMIGIGGEGSDYIWLLRYGAVTSPAGTR